MVTAESFDVLEAPQFTMRDTFVRVRLPRAKRSRPRTQRASSGPGGVRQRRNKYWNW